MSGGLIRDVQAKDLREGYWVFLAGDFRYLDGLWFEPGVVLLKFRDVPLLRVKELQWFKVRYT